MIQIILNLPSLNRDGLSEAETKLELLIDLNHAVKLCYHIEICGGSWQLVLDYSDQNKLRIN